MAKQDLEYLARATSRLFGWLYFLCWSGSFYPQPIFNWKRRSTHGLAIDFPTCNVLGFVAYTISTAAFVWSPTIRSQYAYRYPAAPVPTVRFNDFLFAIHGAVLCIVYYTQFWPWIWGFKVGARQKASMPIKGIVWGSLVAVAVTILVVLTVGNGGYEPSEWAWIDVIYGISYIKLIVTVVKYMPQVYVNYKRKSTVGWSIFQILLDFSGGILSLGQLLIDSSLQADWSGVTGNPVKFGLSNVSMFFDVIFIFQHYILYRQPSEKDLEDGERQALLAPST